MAHYDSYPLSWNFHFLKPKSKIAHHTGCFNTKSSFRISLKVSKTEVCFHLFQMKDPVYLWYRLNVKTLLRLTILHNSAQRKDKKWNKKEIISHHLHLMCAIWYRKEMRFSKTISFSLWLHELSSQSISKLNWFDFLEDGPADVFYCHLSKCSAM